ncbi:MAG: hypothetical protein WD407_10355 [Rhodospirillales bacterium]
MQKPKVILSWSTGKDSAWALHALRSRGEVEVVGLLSTTTGPDTGRRVTVHGVDCGVLRAQAEAAGLPLEEVPLPDPCPNEVYEQAMGAAVEHLKARGVTRIAFGDLFLEDVRAYREVKLQGTGLTPIFPLWGLDTAALARDMIAGGLKAYLISIDTEQLDARFIGRGFDVALLADLPPGCDPCGERGEFHTVTYAGPMFGAPVTISLGEITHGARFCHQEAALD